MGKFNTKEFENMFKAYFEPLVHYANGIIGDMDNSKDIVQQVFTRLWQKREKMDLSRSVKSYLYMSVRNGSINHLRDNKKYQSSVLDIEIYAIGNVALISEPNELYGKELTQKLKVILSMMPEKSRLVFEKSRFENKKYKEIAEELGVGTKTIEAHMSRALKILRTELKDYLITFIIVFLLFRMLL